jgi:hypothetical protein
VPVLIFVVGGVWISVMMEVPEQEGYGN